MTRTLVAWLLGRLGAHASRAELGRMRASTEAVENVASGQAQPRRLRILHFAFEDHRQPASGGGAVRTFEINRRLARRHEITVIARPYPGARRRIDDGIEYRHLGLTSRRFGRILSMVSYHFSVPVYALFHRADLVVEDFAAPMSSVALPLFTRDPTVAVVQWLFAHETSRKYRVPFFLAENLGVRTHRHFIAVSGYIAKELEQRVHAAKVSSPTVTIAYAGVSEVLREAGDWPERRRELLYLGRLQLIEKGLDLLLASFGLLAEEDREVRLVLAGDGYDSESVKELVVRLGLSGRVDFVSRIDGNEKREHLRRASAVVIPSRFESFGVVAVEALASATPVIGFSLPPLLEIVSPTCGILVTPFDTGAFAAACSSILEDAELRKAMGNAGLDRSRKFSWDEAARLQEAAYLAAVNERDRSKKSMSPSSSSRIEADHQWAS